MGRSVAVVVLNWRNAPDTIACLRSLREHDPDVTTVVVDNGSDDGSADEIERTGLAGVFLRSTRNLGYAGGNNLGVVHALDAGFDVVAVLNNDTTVSSPLFSTLRTALPDDELVAISPRIVRADDSTELWFCGGVLDRGLPRHESAAEVARRGPGVHDTELLTGCCIVARSEVWRTAGLFDARLFLFFEDSDWSLRARAAGVRLQVDTRQVLRHRVSSSFQGPARMLGTYYYARNGTVFHLRYDRRHVFRFVRDHVVVPPVRGMLGRDQPLPAWPFGWFGALCGLVGVRGAAPKWLTRLADRRARRHPVNGRPAKDRTV